MVTLTSISTMRGRPIEDGSFYPKIKQKFNNTSPDFINYNPHSSSTSSPQRSPTLKFRGNSSSHNNTTSFSTGSVDLESLNSPAECNPLDQESRNEKVFYPPSSNSASLVAVNPFLISSIVLPKVNGDMVPGKASPQRYIARKGRSLPTLLPGIVGGSSFEEIGSQTNDYDLTKMALSGRHEHKVWRDEVGGPFLEALKIEIMKNRPADLEDFVVAFCEARLQGRALPETTVGQNMGGDGVKLERRAIIRVMKKETLTTDPLSRRGSLESVSFAGGSKRGSFGGTPLLDFSLQKKGSFSNSNITLKLSSDTYSGRRDSAMPIRTDSNLSTASSEDSSIDN